MLLFLVHFIRDLKSVKMFLKLEAPSNILLAGPSQSGKSFWIKQLITYKDAMFKVVPVRVIYAYGAYQPEFENLKKLGVEFHAGLPNKQDLEQWSEIGQHVFLILDDVMQSGCNSPDILTLFTVNSHHMNMTTAFLCQNLFPPGRYSRSISLNAHYIVIFKTKRDQLQVQTLGKQILPNHSKFFAESYENACAEPYGYLFCDLHPATDKKFELRTRIFPGEDTWFYTPIKEGQEAGTYSLNI